MTWLVFGVSCLLVLAGAVSIISGAPIIQLERGWAEVISGTVALASGGVVFALAGILMRIESIRDTLASRTLPMTADAVPALQRIEMPAPAQEPVPAIVAPAARPEPAAEAPAAEAQTPPAIEPSAVEVKDQALWKRVKRPEGEQPSPETLRQHGFPDRILPDGPTEPTSVDEAPVLVPAHAVPAPTIPAPPAEPAAAETAPAREAGQIGWLERSLFKGRPERVEPAMPAYAPPSTERLAFAAPEPTAAAEPQPTPDLASEQHGGATVVGRYQAGSASYVMYSDGTIEVETESGETHRFGSMDELKAFIAQQESAVP
ncbi:hypothetical protein P7D22_20895 [Lichenihabitans sp. Uapishka_5]|uniref:hypothetical protein n=1 Tax=Lichenihabitans sp. Uapishka_5 TaxID=3037302 RepID=UPI0029E7E852|nr:hypothetical protein [Lichenihabitans sp. Uapishka_5]MDX7953625.1 hypothetical protein [Lichenihabitans sp. Uapishka_5]